MRNPLLLVSGFALLIALSSCQNVVQTAKVQDVPGLSQQTTTLHFPQSWLGELESNFIQQLEVRKLSNSTAGELFFAALPGGDYDYAFEVDKKMPKPTYGENMFAVNFSNGLQVRRVTKQEWESGSRLSTKSRLVFARSPDDSSGEIEYKQKRYAKAGKYWGHGMLSPGGKWLAVFSYTGVKPPPNILFGGTVAKGDVFWQVYDTVTGKKVFDWQARNVKHPTQLDRPVVWLDEKYFLFPQDEHAQDFIVVTLPPFTTQVNPVTVKFPSRRDGDGKPVPAGMSHPVWIPLVPLTKEQAARLTAPSETEISDIRLLGQPPHAELLLAITEETENRRVNRQQRDGAGDYHYKLISTYYYAVALDNPTQTRFASKEEWDRSRNVSNRRAAISPEPIADKVKGTYPPYRQFSKSGATWGSPATLSAGEWIAVFSYSSDIGSMFVDVYDQRLGDKLLSTVLPLTVSPNELFKHALWVEGGYMMLPLDSSLDSFAFWQLP